MKGRLKADGVTPEQVSNGQVHVHVEGTFGSGTVALQYANEYESRKLIADQTEADYSGQFKGGQDYEAGDTINLPGKTVITVDAVGGGILAAPYVDNFNRADGALTTPWTQRGTADVVIDGNVAKVVANSLVTATMGDLGFVGPLSEAAFEFDITERSGGDAVVQVHFHNSGGAQIGDRGIAAELYIDNSGVYTKIYNGAQEEQDWTLYTLNTYPVHFRIALVGDTLSFFQDGVPFHTYTMQNAMPTATSIVGFGGGEGVAGYLKIDNLQFYDLTAITAGEGQPVGVVTEFTVTTAGDEVDIELGKEYGQTETSAAGTGFSLTPTAQNTEEQWRAVAGESYTAAADKLLAFPSGTKLRLSLTGATSPNIFYEVR